MFERFRLFKPSMAELKIEELPAFLDEKFRQEKKDLEDRVGENSKEIYSLFLQTREIAAQLKLKTSPNRYATTLKDKFCDKIIQTIKNLQSPGTDQSDLIEFNFLAQQTLRSISSMGLKEFRHLHEFREDMGKIAEKTRLLENFISSSNKIIQGSLIQKIESIKGDVNQLLAIQKSAQKIDTDISDIGNSLVPIDSAIMASKEKSEKLKEQLSGYTSERLEIREMEKILENLKQQIDNEFSGMDRVMKKFVYFGELSKEETHLLKEYIQDSGKTFLDADEHVVIKSILEAMYNYKDRNVIDLDERKAEKLKELLRQMDFLVELRSHYRDVKLRKNEAEDKLNKKSEPLRQALKLSVMETEGKEKEKISLQNKINGKNTEKIMAEKNITDMRSKIELEVSNLLGNQIRLV